MARGFVVERMQQWELFSWNGPRKQGFLFAIKNSRREIGMLIFQRTTIIGRSQAMSRISFNKPTITRLVAKKRAGETGGLLNRKHTKLPALQFWKRIP